jgi:FkbM family methyltransferase
MKPLIFDIGMYDGSDTGYYLETGHRVVAVEANPELIAVAAQRFASDVTSGALTLVNAAISRESGKTLELLTARNDLGSSSLLPSHIAKRGGSDRSFSVTSMTMGDLFAKYGVPLFVKCDIEGADRDCVLALTKENRPEYLSFEVGDDAEELIEHAARCGYDGFKIINQLTFRPLQENNSIRARVAMKIIRLLGYDEPNYRYFAGRKFVLGHSAGPAPFESAGKWIPKQDALALWRRDKSPVWYDVHCKAGH